MSIGSSLGITLPTQGGNSGTWGTDLNAELQKIIDAVEGQVPASAIDFSADFDLNNNALTSVKAVSFELQSSVATLNSLYWNTSGELIARDGANNAIQITSLGGLNNAGAGGLGDSGGTYGTSGITFDWDGTRYNAKDGSGSDDYANVRMDQLQLRDGSGNDLTIAVPTMASNYTVNLPAAVASGASTILQSDASGNCSWSNTFSTDITFSGSAGVKHGSRTLQIHASAGRQESAGSAEVARFATTDHECDLNSTILGWLIPIPLDDGCRITDVTAYVNGGDTGTKQLLLRYKAGADGVINSIGTGGSSSTSGEHTISMVSVSHTIATPEMVYAEFIPTHVDDKIAGIRVTYDRP